jgi:hypothetical protein
MNVLELYSGSGEVSRRFKSSGYNTMQIDNRKRKGICEPDLRIDIMQLSAAHIFDYFKGQVDIVWCSFPCTVFSYAAGNFHFKDGKPQTETAIQMLKLLSKSLALISELSPVYFFIENPRGRLRYEKIMLDWLVRNNGMTKELTYASYGLPITKPTNLFTNAHDFVCRPLHGFGRGNKSPEQIFDNMTVCQRQKVPGTLIDDIINYCDIKLPRALKITGT